MTDILLQTKLHRPPLRPFLVPRPRLIDKLDAGAGGKLTLLSTPAGFGKTTLLALYFTGRGLPAAWLSLDKDDNRHGRFLHYLLAALQQLDPVIGEEGARLLKASPQLPPPLILTSLVNDLAATNREIYLILDDYHLITSQAVHDAVAFLLEYGPRTFHLVIASRSDPPLPLARLRARRQMVELRAADLRFSEAETAQFLIEAMSLPLDPAAAAKLAGRTEGWIAGLQMAALSMQSRDDLAGFIENFSGTNRYILDYLLEEVLAREPKEVQIFLLQTAILHQLSGPLCDAVTGASNSQALLEKLEQRNLFVVPLDDERRWYRYHHLFADLLQARLQQSGPEQAARLLSRAAVWCGQNGQAAEAVAYALAAQDVAQAAGLIARYWGDAFRDGEIELVWSWLQALPAQVIRDSAPLGLAACWADWARGELNTLAAHLIDAERAMQALATGETDGGEPDTAGLKAQLAALQAFVARYHGDFATAVSLTDRSLHLLPANSPPEADAYLRSMIFLARATAYDGAGQLEEAVTAYEETIRWSRLGANAAGVAGITYRLSGALRLLGRLRAADDACRQALDYMEAQGMARLPAAGILHLAMSEVLLEQNRLAEAEAHLSQGMELGRWSGRLDAARNAAPALARLRLAQGDLAGGLTAVQTAESALPEPPPPLAKAELLALKARLLLAQGSLAEAARTADEAVRLADNDQGQTGQMAALAAARVLLAQDQTDTATARLNQAVAAAEENGRAGAAIELRILRSLAQAHDNQLPAAEADLERTLFLAAAEGYVRLFLDEGPAMHSLLQRWLDHARPGPLREYASRLLAQFAAGPPLAAADPADTLAEPLSPRELEVLQLIALGQTNKQIAQQLVVAPGTIKAHTASIYRKLDVANRTEAVAQARELGILP